MRVSATGGNPVAITKIDSTQPASHRWPFFLPDGKHFLYLDVNTRDLADTVYYASMDGRERRPLLQSRSNAIYSGGFLLFIRSGVLMAQPFDPGSGTLSGAVQSVTTGVMEDASTWHMDVSASNNGLLIFANGATGAFRSISRKPTACRASWRCR